MSNKERVFAVIGLGTFGMQICETIAESGKTVIAIDNTPELIERVKDTATQAVLLDSTDEAALAGAPLEDVDIVVVAIGENIESSIITTALLKKIGVPYVISRSISKIHHQVLRQVGADEVVNPELDEGKRIAQKLISPEILDTVSISQTISIAEIYAPAFFAGKSLRELDLRSRFSVNIVSIKRDILAVDEIGNPVKNETIIFPGPEDNLQENDILIVVGKNEDIRSLQEAGL